MDEHRLLGEPQLTVVSGEPDEELRQIERSITHCVTVDGSEALDRLLDRLLGEVDRAAAVVPKTLDLIGHTRSTGSVLALGDWVVDAGNLTTMTVFRGLAARGVLPRLGVHALRLLGCNTASTPQGRATICRLSDLLGLEVYGTTQLLYAAHYGPEGFRDCWRFLLVGASELHRGADEGGAGLAWLR